MMLLFMVDFTITDTLSMRSQPPKSPTPLAPLNPPAKGGKTRGPFASPLRRGVGGNLSGDFGKVGVIGKCPLISLIHHSSGSGNGEDYVEGDTTHKVGD